MHRTDNFEYSGSDPRRVVDGTRIRIANVTKADNAVLQCLASNEHGQILANAMLTVIGEFIQ
jgi:hypothetical protein